eukprot:2701010-Karenia_brevis.AAC.1
MRQRVASRSKSYDVTADAITAISLSLIPSVSALTTRFSHLGPKALGESGVGGELLRVAPSLMAQIYHPISTKFILNGCPPVQWAGGQVCEYPKVGGPPGCPASFRDITICDASAKP